MDQEWHHSLNALHDILANSVNLMRGFLQIFSTGTDKTIAIRYLFSHGINTSHLLRFRASGVEERISSDTLGKCFT